MDESAIALIFNSMETAFYQIVYNLDCFVHTIHLFFVTHF